MQSGFIADTDKMQLASIENVSHDAFLKKKENKTLLQRKHGRLESNIFFHNVSLANRSYGHAVMKQPRC